MHWQSLYKMPIVQNSCGKDKDIEATDFADGTDFRFCPDARSGFRFAYFWARFVIFD
jgi:hypothetical protein